MRKNILGLLIIAAMIGAFIIIPTVNTGANSNAMNLAILGNMLPANNNNNNKVQAPVDNNNVVEEQPETTTPIVVKAINSGANNPDQSSSEAYDTSLLRQTTQTNTEYTLTTETQQAQQQTTNTQASLSLEEVKIIPFTVTVPDSYSSPTFTFDLQAKLHIINPNYPNPPNVPLPVVICVHGAGASGDDWQGFTLYEKLLTNGLAVITYTQRNTLFVSNFVNFMMDLRLVIDTAIANFNGVYIDGSRIALVGLSLGGYVVAMAACQDTGYLGTDYGRIKVVIAGAPPDNLKELTEYWKQFLGTGIPGWSQIAIDAAPEPKSYGKDLTHIIDPAYGLDHAKSINVPFYVYAHSSDRWVPPYDFATYGYSGFVGNAQPLWVDATYIGYYWWHCTWWVCSPWCWYCCSCWAGYMDYAITTRSEQTSLQVSDWGVPSDWMSAHVVWNFQNACDSAANAIINAIYGPVHVT